MYLGKHNAKAPNEFSPEPENMWTKKNKKIKTVVMLCP
jgi:hypothetical protein